MTRKETAVAHCGHEVTITVFIGSDGSEEFDFPSACTACEAAAEAEAERYQSDGEAAAHLNGAWG